MPNWPINEGIHPELKSIDIEKASKLFIKYFTNLDFSQQELFLQQARNLDLTPFDFFLKLLRNGEIDINAQPTLPAKDDVIHQEQWGLERYAEATTPYQIIIKKGDLEKIRNNKDSITLLKALLWNTMIDYDYNAFERFEKQVVKNHLTIDKGSLDLIIKMLINGEKEFTLNNVKISTDKNLNAKMFGGKDFTLLKSEATFNKFTVKIL